MRESILARWPWAVSAAHRIEEYLSVLREARSPDVRLPPILLVGEPGCGKTSIAAFVAQALVLPYEVVACAGTSDGGGISAVTRGWSTARPGAVANAFLRELVCNPVMILDEIDKSSPIGSQNGSVQGALLSMMMSKSYTDACLMSAVDISSVTFMGTANSTKTIERPLLERFNVVRVESPGPAHFEILLANARADFLADNRLDERRLPYLPADSVELLRRFLASRPSARSFRMAYDVMAMGLLHDAQSAWALPPGGPQLRH